MNWYTQLESDVELAVKSAWSDITRLYKFQQMQRLHWLNDVTDGSLVPPWGITAIGAAHKEPGWCPSANTFRLTVTAYYVSISIPPDMTAIGRQKCITLQEKLLQFRYHGFQIPDNTLFQIDETPDNPAMSLIMETNTPYVAVGLNFDVLAGYGIGSE